MWIYKNKELTEEDIDLKAVGFIYIITNKINQKKYIGRKLLTKAAYKIIKGKKKKVRKISDWKDYFGSCKELLDDIELLGKDNFERKIICFCTNKIQMTYIEEKLQYKFEVLESENFYNSNIRARIFKKSVLNKLPLLDLDLN